MKRKSETGTDLKSLGGGSAASSGKEMPTVDDMVLLKHRQDEFRAGYANWRMGGLKGARGEVGTGLATEGASTGEEGLRAGNLNWRRGGAAGARDGGSKADARTQNAPVGGLMTHVEVQANPDPPCCPAVG
jgi:hypothetical protein